MESYTIAVVADIHGNADALEAVLSDLATQPYNALVVAGDLVMNGPKPLESLALVRALDAPTLCGNNEWSIAEARDSPSPDPGVEWVREQLDEEGLDYIASLPLQHRITPPGGSSPEDDLLVVHATPTDVFGVIITEPHPLGTTFTEVTPEDEVVAMLGGAEADLILYGHIHYASSGVVRGQRLASIGSVGFPYDGDTRAAYALVTWDGDGWRVAHRRVQYDHLAVAAALRQSDFPFAEISARRIVEADWIRME